tara:strand:+ start:601 stop:702 length:102 start_codon:yes stop_codon:yes gene_type:complete
LLKPHDWNAAMPVTAVSQYTAEVKYFFDWVQLI